MHFITICNLFSMPLPNIHNRDMRLVDGELAGLSNLRRLGKVNFSEKNNKVSTMRGLTIAAEDQEFPQYVLTIIEKSPTSAFT